MESTTVIETTTVTLYPPLTANELKSCKRKKNFPTETLRLKCAYFGYEGNQTYRPFRYASDRRKCTSIYVALESPQYRQRCNYWGLREPPFRGHRSCGNINYDYTDMYIRYCRKKGYPLPSLTTWQKVQCFFSKRHNFCRDISY